MNTLVQYTPPWKQYPLSEWAIEQMNHSIVKGERWLWVVMKKGTKIITERGPDDTEVWSKLFDKALEEIL